MKKLRILVVDDDQDFAEGVADAFELEGHEVALARTGEEALETFTEFEFDLTFMDVKLPGRNGVESFLEIRRRFPGARVVIMTAFSMEDLLDRARERGVIGLFHKPLPMAEVLALLERVQRGARVLVVDKDVDFARELRDVLELAGYSVRSRFDGESAIAKCHKESFDALVIDPSAPDFRATDLLAAIRAIHPGLPIIPMTENSVEGPDLTGVGGHGAIAPPLRKPFSPDALLGALRVLETPPSS